MIRVVVAEDQALILGALSALLRLEADISVVAQARDGEEALQLCRRLEPNVLVTDVEMPGLSGIEVAGSLKALGSATRVVVLTTFARPGYLRRAMSAGVRGYLLKESPSELLAAAVRKVSAGGREVAAELAESVWDADPDPLTDRERAILRLAETGLPNREIALVLRLSPGTVRNYLSEAAQKVGGANRIEATRIARAKGWL